MRPRCLDLLRKVVSRTCPTVRNLPFQPELAQKPPPPTHHELHRSERRSFHSPRSPGHVKGSESVGSARTASERDGTTANCEAELFPFYTALPWQVRCLILFG